MSESAEISDVAEAGARAGRRAESSTALDRAVRAGLVAFGIVHLMLGWIALRLAFGDRPAKASTTGALRELARQPFGRVLVGAVAVGLAALVVWRLLEAAFGHRRDDGATRLRKRLTSVAKAILYGVLAVSAAEVALRAGSGGGSRGTTATVLDWPGGQWLVAGAGIAVVGYGGILAWRGWTDRHLEHLDAEGHRGDAGTAYRILGKVGYVGKGVSFAVVGVLFVLAGLHHRSGQSGGLDRALSDLLRQPGGRVPIALIGVGLICYGLFAFARARHLRR